MKKRTNIRSILKALTYRSLSTICTFFAAWIITGNIIIGMTLGLFEVTFKLFLYYFHERVWYKINYGMKYSKNKKDDKTISISFLKNNGFVEIDGEKALILSINGEIDLMAARRRSTCKGKSCYKVKIKDTNVAMCKKRGDVINLVETLNK